MWQKQTFDRLGVGFTVCLTLFLKILLDATEENRDYAFFWFMLEI